MAMCPSTANPPFLSRQTKIHNIGATLVGVDKFGNKYYEKLHDTQHGEYILYCASWLLKLLLLWNSSVWLHWKLDHEGDALCVLTKSNSITPTAIIFQYFTSYFLSSNL